MSANLGTWSVNIKKSIGPIETPWGSQMRNIEHRIKEGDKSSIRARWESGHHILKRREGKQLPKGLLGHLCKALKVSQKELSFRVVFAEAYPTEGELSKTLTKFKTWNQIITKALPKKRNRASVSHLKLTAVNGLIRHMHHISPEQLSPKEVKALQALAVELKRLVGIGGSN